jgi:hypothetical protein
MNKTMNKQITKKQKMEMEMEIMSHRKQRPYQSPMVSQSNPQMNRSKSKRREHRNGNKQLKPDMNQEYSVLELRRKSPNLREGQVAPRKVAVRSNKRQRSEPRDQQAVIKRMVRAKRYKRLQSDSF